MNKAVEDALNGQIKMELDSAHLYLAMVAYFESQGLSGFAHWFRCQQEEETEHAMKLFDYLNDRGGRVLLQGIEQPPAEFGSPLEAFERSLEHEKKVTASIDRLYELAVAEKDHATAVMLHWFIEEQVEEEKSAEDIIHQLKIGGDTGTALLRLDRHLGRREAE